MPSFEMRAGLGAARHDRDTFQKPDPVKWGRFELIAILLALCACVIPLAICTVSAFNHGGFDRVSLTFLIATMLCALAAVPLYVIYKRGPAEARVRRITALSSTVLSLGTIAVVSTFVFRFTGVLDWFEAWYESTTGVATSSLTIIEHPQDLHPAVLIWRAMTQWLGGLVALAAVITILPFFGGTIELLRVSARQMKGDLTTTPKRAIKRGMSVYLIASSTAFFALLAAGLTPTAALAHAASTVSTGGFSIDSENNVIEASRAVQLITTFFMLGAAVSITAAWKLWRGQLRRVIRSTELRVFLTVVVFSIAATWWWRPEPMDLGSLADSAFTVVSLISTTGFEFDKWASWPGGSVAIFLFLMSIGGMAGSISGGFRWLRALAIAQIVRAQVLSELHPRMVRPVRLYDSEVTPTTIDRIQAQLVHVMIAGTVTAAIVGFFGAPMLEAYSLAISAVATAGPGAGDLPGLLETSPTESTHIVTVTNAIGLPKVSQAALAITAFGSRLFLYPMLVLAGTFWFGLRRRVQRARS